MRGKRRLARAGSISCRIIPAHAGQTRLEGVSPPVDADHPRACGANKAGCGAHSASSGSSPRMRGKHHFLVLIPVGARIIPAHAGQTSVASRAQSAASDHPRACGANFESFAFASPVVGSSPRMRGKLRDSYPQWASKRIIPAHAGQTGRFHPHERRRPDHPRACGANRTVLIPLTIGPGSSPRMRGKLHAPLPTPRDSRIIPAHAGQTVRFYAKTLERWTLNNWIRTVAPIFVLLFLPPVIGQNAYIERHYSNQSFSWFSKLHYASAFDLSLVA